QVLVTYQNASSGNGPDSIKVNLESDGLGAAGFSAAIIPTTTQVGAFAPIPAQPKREIDAEAGLAWDRSGGPHQGRVYLVYTDRPSTSSNDTDIYVRYSDHNGTTCSSRVRGNDDPVRNGASHFLPRITPHQAAVLIAVSRYHCLTSPGNPTGEA